MDTLPQNWLEFFDGYIPETLWREPLEKAALRRTQSQVFPPENKVFNAFYAAAPEDIRVILLGQDPYHDDGQAEGLAFSVPDGVRIPPSLQNIFKEYSADLGRPLPRSGHLGKWAANGVLLLNAVLTVDAHKAGSHRNFGWEKFTDAVIGRFNAEKERKVFILWGSFALKKAALIDSSRHTVIASVHPSPLSAYRGFFGSKPFSRAVDALGDWQWPEL